MAAVPANAVNRRSSTPCTDGGGVACTPHRVHSRRGVRSARTGGRPRLSARRLARTASHPPRRHALGAHHQGRRLRSARAQPVRHRSRSHGAPWDRPLAAAFEGGGRAGDRHARPRLTRRCGDACTRSRTRSVDVAAGVDRFTDVRGRRLGFADMRPRSLSGRWDSECVAARCVARPGNGQGIELDRRRLVVSRGAFDPTIVRRSPEG
jgi:hypothetical protein